MPEDRSIEAKQLTMAEKVAREMYESVARRAKVAGRSVKEQLKYETRRSLSDSCGIGTGLAADGKKVLEYGITEEEANHIRRCEECRKVFTTRFDRLSLDELLITLTR